MNPRDNYKRPGDEPGHLLIAIGAEKPIMSGEESPEDTADFLHWLLFGAPRKR